MIVLIHCQAYLLMTIYIYEYKNFKTYLEHIYAFENLNKFTFFFHNSYINLPHKFKITLKKLNKDSLLLL
jgi:hypothetical protein